jgi:hypothetical protein
MGAQAGPAEEKKKYQTLKMTKKGQQAHNGSTLFFTIPSRGLLTLWLR